MYQSLKLCRKQKVELHTTNFYSCYFFIQLFGFFGFFFVFLGLHMEVPRLGVELEMQLLAYATATATWDLSHVYDLHYSLWQHRILNPLSEAGDRTHILMDCNWIHFRCTTMRTPSYSFESLPSVFLFQPAETPVSISCRQVQWSHIPHSFCLFWNVLMS